MRIQTVTFTLMSREVGDVPNLKPGPWNGRGDREMVRVREIPDDRLDIPEQLSFLHICDRDAAMEAYEMFKRLGYNDPHDDTEVRPAV